MKIISLLAFAISGVGVFPKVLAHPHRTTRPDHVVKFRRNQSVDDMTESPTLVQLYDQAHEAVQYEVWKHDQTTACTSEKLVFRREYGSLTRQEKLDYINAVKCLQTLPARTPANVSSGARSRFDDFIVTHIQQTLSIHFTGNFQPWHRWFVYQYEKALRDECGYTGYQPYWDWPKYASAPQDSPMFDGSETSIGGNGNYIPHDGAVIVPPPGTGGINISLPSGLGGGFVTTGAFAHMQVNLGPVVPLQDGTPTGPEFGLGYNPRGLKRDLGPLANTRFANYTTVLDLLQKPDIDCYRYLLDGTPWEPEIGPHGGIHYTIGGDPGGDLFTGPGDPAFYLHHSMMDRMWSTWQALGGFGGNRFTNFGTGNYSHVTWGNFPPSDFTKLTDKIDMGYAAPSTTIDKVMSTVSEEFCYFYF
ncbi:hypothetical protein QBC35DRAFT_544200 [Podospora australis]|uniref:Tyrosinase copper-binding domain-containing protein n=1 Tax=Podospora australis TaxID=1536484 RepID=A0AAN6WK24_9PEZI|nr:hypothetical protein QBC35DRAFT_544200 [Podospora australis]